MPRSFILNLPPEILGQILGLILGRISFERRLGIRRSGTGIIALLLTCQRIYRLTVPLLYRELEFCYPSGRRTNCLYRALRSDPSLLLPVRSLVLVLQRDRTKTCISLADYAAAADVLSLFCGAKVHTLRIQGEVENDAALQQPTTCGLVEFSLAFDELLKSRIPHTPATVKVFYPWLQAHPHTLRRMVFGAIPFYALGLEFRASTFPNLHTVVCPPFHVISETHPRVYWRPAAAIDQLLSPTVRTFVWDLISYGDFWGPGLLGFDEPQARWLLAFAEGALAGKSQALRTIRIEFVPYIDWLGYVDPDEYPWDRMEQLKQKMCLLGIALEYNTPTLTREEYSRSCKEVRQLVESGQLPPMVDRV
ncbi:uncharacterized protein BO72DRAFT_515324 [Aspergillus fijiensis CBS 313.89]|uniref:F-box domain-containing protein n=1 Tax=Aspergillus fijiensis CBS 313.89 TaxID=1448319 RepID=A0A8G1VZ29_9EURO|nr:uncharacterized protein BO72DRAFT_515324 [Aspergillus fijiensis CBS 313.89]RAK74599.1 hypothetical protein BO72DRAFT_515324 [Aspergillus fijiensis CBS 313.89]